MTAITEIKLIMRTSIVDEQITSRAHTRNMNSTTISNRKDINTYGAMGAAPLSLRLSPMSLRKRLPRSGKKSSSVVAASSRESALPKFQQRPPNGAQEGVSVGDVAATEWSAGVAHEVVDGAPP